LVVGLKEKDEGKKVKVKSIYKLILLFTPKVLLGILVQTG